ncbi:ATP-binding protein [Frankia sp. AgB1.9]|uniref:sensor histidine kinase n=1 Tax=unclassified Frankia TaxID=2632575 RepID=UPI0019331B5B|nr:MULTISPECIES: histidine kinase [unclassified Frankia]MBL7486732.1 ATP-binding protein [Frankia sp. AgW1.1]MBL7551803.1 ATP-binding protein [Frankia sp. AgB1.9]MBL7623160.1 ATP-binding protein [Frankia sp. AgB1.8]
MAGVGRWRGRLRRAVDVALPLLVTGFLLAALSDEPGPKSGALLWCVSGPAAIVQGLALYWRRSRPVLVTAVALIGCLVLYLAAPDLVVPFTGLIAVCSLAAARAPAVSIPGLIGLLAVTSANFRTGTAEDTYFTMAMGVVAWALGEVARNRRVAIEQESRRAVVEERSRIAREMHDVIAHSVSVIVVQAAAADDVFETRPDQARQALRTIESTGREALVELRWMLGAVRPGSVNDDIAPPQPGLGRVDELAAPLRAAGLDVRIHQAGTVRLLAPGVDVSAYRIVQEALTNTLRHARADSVEVGITYADESIEIEVVDDGRGGGRGTQLGDPATDGVPSGRGHGIIGMRERASLLGGTLTAEPTRAGGFRVHAYLPARGGPRTRVAASSEPATS